MKKHEYALLIIDMQNDFVLPNIPNRKNTAYQILPTVKELLSAVREQEWPVFHIVREYRADGSDIEHTRLESFLSNPQYAVPGTEGCEIVTELAPLKNEYRIVKNRFSAFMQTELDFILRRLGVKHLIISGTQIPNCIRATVYDAVSYEYQVTVINDAISAKQEDVATANIIDMKNIGVVCISFEEFRKNILTNSAIK